MAIDHIEVHIDNHQLFERSIPNKNFKSCDNLKCTQTHRDLQLLNEFENYRGIFSLFEQFLS